VHQEAEKVSFRVAKQMNESYGMRALPNWHLRKPALEEIRTLEYGKRVGPEKELVRYKGGHNFISVIIIIPWTLRAPWIIW